MPPHREAWRALAREDGCRGLYLRFVDVICNDVQYLLDDTLKVLPQVRGMQVFRALNPKTCRPPNPVIMNP